MSVVSGQWSDAAGNAESGMGKQEWWRADARLQMANAKWQMTNGRRQMKDARWRRANQNPQSKIPNPKSKITT